MKTIIYSLVAILILGIIATGFTNKSNDTKKIIIQSTDNKISSASLAKSAEIITNRLKSFKSEKFDVITISGKNQIQVTFMNNRNLKYMESLIAQKGAIEFYETYNYKSLAELLNVETLSSLLHSEVPGDSSAKIGCTSDSEVNKVNKYLNSTGLKQKCKFMWSNLFEDSDVCLYALKLENGNGLSLSGKDIEGFKITTQLKKDCIEFKFKGPAIKLWSDVTKRSMNRSIAVVLDNKVIYSPLVRSEMNDGRCEISGNFTPDQLQYIAAIGNNGELPVSFEILK